MGVPQAPSEMTLVTAAAFGHYTVNNYGFKCKKRCETETNVKVYKIRGIAETA